VLYLRFLPSRVRIRKKIDIFVVKAEGFDMPSRGQGLNRKMRQVGFGGQKHPERAI
jgi:hypothetical protein